MSQIHVTRQQKRKLQRLADKVDEATQADRRFFERFPHRQHRVRVMAAAEVASVAVVSPLNPIAPGRARFTIVKNIARGCRMRAFIFGPADHSGDETSEAVAEALWNHHCEITPGVREREEAFAAAARLPGGPLHDGGAA